MFNFRLGYFFLAGCLVLSASCSHKKPARDIATDPSELGISKNSLCQSMAAKLLEGSVDFFQKERTDFLKKLNRLYASDPLDEETQSLVSEALFSNLPEGPQDSVLFLRLELWDDFFKRDLRPTAISLLELSKNISEISTAVAPLLKNTVKNKKTIWNYNSDWMIRLIFASRSDVELISEFLVYFESAMKMKIFVTSEKAATIAQEIVGIDEVQKQIIFSTGSPINKPRLSRITLSKAKDLMRQKPKDLARMLDTVSYELTRFNTSNPNFANMQDSNIHIETIFSRAADLLIDRIQIQQIRAEEGSFDSEFEGLYAAFNASILEYIDQLKQRADLLKNYHALNKFEWENTETYHSSGTKVFMERFEQIQTNLDTMRSAFDSLNFTSIRRTK